MSLSADWSACADYAPDPLDRIRTFFDHRRLAAGNARVTAGEVCLRRPDSEMGKTIG